MKLSIRVESLKPSPTLALAAKAKELSAQGHDVIALSVGEPDWDSFDSAKQAGIQAIQEGFTKYTPAQGIPELRAALTETIKKELGILYKADEVTVSVGGKFVLFSALQTLLSPGDEVIIPAPYWVSYPTMVELATGQPRHVVCDQSMNFKLTPEALEKAIAPRTRALILNSPSNPTGLVYSRAELAALAEVLRRHPDIVIISDDIYNRLVFSEPVAPHLLHVAPDFKDRLLVLSGAAKSFSMTGWRVGWALGPLAWIKAMNNYQSQSVSCATSIAQKATLAALTAGESELKTAVKNLLQKRDFAHEKLSSIQGLKVDKPDGAFYLWPDIKCFLGKKYEGRTLSTSSDFAQALLESQKVVTVPGIEFGLDGYLRLSYVVSPKAFEKAVDRIRIFCSKIS